MSPQTTLFAIIPEWVIYGTSANAVKVYAVLDRHANKERVAFPSLKRMSELCGVSIDTVRRAIRELEEAGALDRQHRTREDGGTTSSNYLLVRDMPPPPGTGATSPLAPVPGAIEREPSNETQGLAALDATGADPAPPKLVKVDGRNLGYDALADVCGIDPRGNRAGLIATALNGKKLGAGVSRRGIRDLAYRTWLMLAHQDDEKPEAFERFVASQVRHKAALYGQHLKGATLTPTALQSWWTDLHDDPTMIARTLSPEEIAAYAAGKK